MQGLLKLFSSWTAGPVLAPAAAVAPADAGGSNDAPLQPRLPLEGVEPAPAEPLAISPARPATRALRSGTRPSTSVAVPAPPEPVMPTVAPPTGGVVLTQTERVRLRIMQAQIRLAGLSLYEGPIDGMLTLETATALRYFQTLKGLRESGQPTAATLRALGIPADR